MQCFICYEVKDNIKATYPCGHLFCHDCLDKYFRLNGMKCPYCNIYVKDYIRVYNCIVEDNENTKALNKSLKRTKKYLEKELTELEKKICSCNRIIEKKKKEISLLKLK